MENVVEFLSSFEDVLEVVILEDNKFICKELIIKKSIFLDDLKLEKFIFCGAGNNEFYITIGAKEFTIQVSNFVLDTEIGF